jgi:hypothetical protein
MKHSRGLNSSASSRRGALAIGGAYPGARKGSIAMERSALRAIWTCFGDGASIGNGDGVAIGAAAAPMRAPRYRWTARQQRVGKVNNVLCSQSGS